MKFLVGIVSFCWKIIVGVVFTITALFFYPFLAILVQRPSWHRAAFKGFVIWSWMVRILCFYHVRKLKKVELPSENFIIIANHASYLDIFLLPSIFPKHPYIFLGKAEILKYPLIRTYFKKFNIPVFRNNRVKAAKSYIQCKRALQNNWSLVIFPEGGIPDTDHPKMIPFKDGAFRLAKDAGVGIIPVTFENNFKLFSDPLDILGLARPGISKVHIHEVISAEEVKASSIEELKNTCFEVINVPLLERYPHLNKNA